MRIGVTAAGLIPPLRYGNDKDEYIIDSSLITVTSFHKTISMTQSNQQQSPRPALSHATRFTNAITRRPAASAVDGLRAYDMGAVDMQRLLKQHSEYLTALKQAGATITELPPLADFPDAQFVEDTALCLPGLAVMMHPGAKTRRGEVLPMRAALLPLFHTIADITDGYIEAGDILTTPSEVLIGLSARTNEAGATHLGAILTQHGYAWRVLKTPPDVLHFKTDCSLIDDHTILSTQRLASSGCFEGYKILLVPAGEEAAANMIRYNDHIIMPDGFPKTKAMLLSQGYEVLTVGNSECAKIDGGMSCLSLRF